MTRFVVCCVVLCLCAYVQDTQELIESSDSSDSSDGRHSPTALGSSSSQPRRHSTRRRVAPKW